jgi:hypothetical protein
MERRKSSNYADAVAAASASRFLSQPSGSLPQGDDAAENSQEEAEGAPGGAAVGWKPKVGRKQSWNQQDLKRAMQMSVMSESQGPGFSSGRGTPVEGEKRV